MKFLCFPKVPKLVIILESFAKLNPFKPAVMNASHKFQDAYIRKFGIKQIWTDKFSSIFEWEFKIALQNATQNLKSSFNLEEKFKLIQIGRLDFLKVLHKALK